MVYIQKDGATLLVGAWQRDNNSQRRATLLVGAWQRDNNSQRINKLKEKCSLMP